MKGDSIATGQQSTAGSDLIGILRAITRSLQICPENGQNDDLEDMDRPGFELYVCCLHSLLEASMQVKMNWLSPSGGFACPMAPSIYWQNSIAR